MLRTGVAAKEESKEDLKQWKEGYTKEGYMKEAQWIVYLQ